jgi:predicted dehydrogenase
MTRTVRVGIIGSGGIAGAHARAYAEMPDVEVVAVMALPRARQR